MILQRTGTPPNERALKTDLFQRTGTPPNERALKTDLFT